MKGSPPSAIIKCPELNIKTNHFYRDSDPNWNCIFEATLTKNQLIFYTF